MLLQRHDTDLVLDEARSTTRRVARTFSIACRLLPREVRDDVYRLYLVFRTLDDLVDDGDPRALSRIEAVERWARSGEARSREARLLEDLATRYPVPRDAMLDFCRGMRFDLCSGHVETEADLDRYCYQVAGTVGVVMAALLGTRVAGAERHAAALGMAMQRTNILRDVDEDLAAGRVYLAAETLRRFSGSAGVPEPALRAALLRDQIARADALYEVGCAGIPMLCGGRRAVAAAAGMYREILRQMERSGLGAVPGRTVVPPARKLLVAVRSGVAA